MILVHQYAEMDCGFIKTGEQQQEYSCPYCYKPIKWVIGKSMSPFNCPGCREKLPDITKVISNLEWRIAYHIGGRNAVLCSSSLQG